MRLDDATKQVLPWMIIVVATVLATPPAFPSEEIHIGEPVSFNILEGVAEGTKLPTIRVIDRADDSLTLSFELPSIQAQSIDLDGVTYQALGIEGGGESGAPGEPLLPTFTRFLQIPATSGVTVEVLDADTKDFGGILPIPMQPPDAAEFTKNDDAYARQNYNTPLYVRVGDPVIMRDLRLVPLTFSPVRCSPGTQSVEVAGRIEVRVTFAGHDERNRKQYQHRVLPRTFDNLYQHLVVNYDGARDAQTIGLGSYVLICPDNPSVVDALQPLVEWRSRKGFDVYLATTAETGSTAGAIRSWLVQAYETWENPPEYITLVGDTSGSIALPCFTQGGGGTDHDYCQLDGEDLLADAHVGRISVASLDQLDVYVDKIVGYESMPDQGNPDWYKRACVVGDPSSSGPTTVHAMQWLKDRLQEWGYTQVDTVFSSPFVTQMRNSVNNGVGVFGYRGYYGMSGWNVSNIYSLQNDGMLPYCVNLTCDTGSFNAGESVSEAWIRAGAVGSPTGGIASIGTSTIFTHTRYNNCMTYGVWSAVFWEDAFYFGSSLTRGKYELYLNYYDWDSSGATHFTHWNNLMGDPAGELWTDTPRPMGVSHDPEIALGANVVRVLVTTGGLPLEGAYVHLWSDGLIRTGSFTNAEGFADVPLETSSAGEVKLTVSKHDYAPYLATLPIVSPNYHVAYETHLIDDDEQGDSQGNGNGAINPLETIELPVQVRNLGMVTANDVMGTLTTDDPYITLLDNTEVFGTIAGGDTAWSEEDFDIFVAAGCPDGHSISFELMLTSGDDSWYSLLQLPVVAAAFEYAGLSTNGFGEHIDPGEAGTLTVALINNGNAIGQDVTATLVSNSAWVQVTADEASYGTMMPGGLATNSLRPYGINVVPECMNGHLARMSLLVSFSGGACDTVLFTLDIGTQTTTDPTGPCAYGYYAFDNGDIGYSDAPTYDWVEIAPNHGGAGTSLGLTDYDFGYDDVVTVDLPFTFAYYGQTFTRASICSNGWMSMGSTWLVNPRNWNIPGAGAPPNLIAPMWDNFYLSGSDVVYHWYDVVNHRYVIQWSRVKNNWGDAVSNFEVILYDEAYYPTDTDDGIILFQYETFANVDYLQHYSTIGIQDAEHSTGVMYGYFNDYNDGAAPIVSGTAIRFVPVANLPRGTLNGTVTNLTAGGAPLGEAEVKVVENGHTLYSDADGHYEGTVPVGTYTLVADFDGFIPDSAFGISIIEGQVTSHNFALVDTAGPIFSGTTQQENTTDQAGPYVIETTVTEHSGIEQLTLYYRTLTTEWSETPLTNQGDNLFGGEIPGQPLNSTVIYYLYGLDIGGNESCDPIGAPDNTYLFYVLAPIVEDAFEAGPGDWTHEVVTSGFHDQWHLSTQRNHSTGGTSAWKFGDPGGSEYTDYADGALITPTFELGSDAAVTFWHWMHAEISSAYPGYAYDGGVIEISIGGGPWNQITPDGGYPYLIRERTYPGPFSQGTPVLSGSHDWKKETIQLIDISGTIQLRFRFGSDAGGPAEGWYIDDVLILGTQPDLSDIGELSLLPAHVRLYQNQPNPFRAAGGATMIQYDLPDQREVRLQMLDVSGRLVRTLADGLRQAGTHLLQWDGTNEHGERVGSGVYFYVLITGKEETARQVLVVQ